jgi:DNA-binding MarR family transcriptional regulator
MDIDYDRDASFGYLTNLASRLFVRALERRVPGGAIGPMPVFIALQNGEALPQKELARLAAVEQPTMANTLARMARDGLVAGEPDPDDGRSTLLRLTALGQERAQVALAAAKTVNTLAAGALGAGERAIYLDLVKRIIARLEADG